MCDGRRGCPTTTRSPDAAYNFCTVRSLDAWDLSMLKVLNDDMRVKYDAYWSRVKRRAARREGAARRSARRKKKGRRA